MSFSPSRSPHTSPVHTVAHAWSTCHRDQSSGTLPGRLQSLHRPCPLMPTAGPPGQLRTVAAGDRVHAEVREAWFPVLCTGHT